MPGGFCRREGDFMQIIAVFIQIEFLIVGFAAFRTFKGTFVCMVLADVLPEIRPPIVCRVSAWRAICMDVRALERFVFEFAQTIMEGRLVQHGCWWEGSEAFRFNFCKIEVHFCGGGYADRENGQNALLQMWKQWI